MRHVSQTKSVLNGKFTGAQGGLFPLAQALGITGASR